MSQVPVQNLVVEIGDLWVSFLGDLAQPQAQNAYACAVHIHGRYEFQYILSGELTERIHEQQVLQVPAGSVLLLPPGVPHRNETQECCRLVLAIALQQRETQGEFSEFEHYIRLLSRLRAPAVFQCPEIDLCVAQLLQTGSAPEHLHRKKILLSMLFLQLCRKVEEEVGGQENPFPHRVRRELDLQCYLIEQTINSRYTRPLTLQQVADVLHVSTRQANRIIREIFGMSFLELLTQRRISAACCLLRGTDLPCAVIAEKVGYRSYPGFFTAFRRCCGISPEQFRACVPNNS